MLDIGVRMRSGGVWRHMGAYRCLTDAYECIRMHVDAYGCILGTRHIGVSWKSEYPIRECVFYKATDIIVP